MLEAVALAGSEVTEVEMVAEERAATEAQVETTVGSSAVVMALAVRAGVVAVD